MLESITEDEESPRRKRKKKKRKKLSGVWSAETRLDESGNKIYSEEEDQGEHQLESTSSASESSKVSFANVDSIKFIGLFHEKTKCR